MNNKYDFKKASLRKIVLNEPLNFEYIHRIDKKLYQIDNSIESELNITSNNFDLKLFPYFLFKIITPVVPKNIIGNNNVISIIEKIGNQISPHKKENSDVSFNFLNEEYYIYKFFINKAKDDLDNNYELIIEKIIQLLKDNNIMAEPSKYDDAEKLMEFFNSIGEILSNAYIHSMTPVIYVSINIDAKKHITFSVYDSGETIIHNVHKYKRGNIEIRRSELDTIIRNKVDYFKWALENKNSTKTLIDENEKGGNGLPRIIEYSKNYKEDFFLFSGGVFAHFNGVKKIPIQKIEKSVESITFASISYNFKGNK